MGFFKLCYVIKNINIKRWNPNMAVKVKIHFKDDHSLNGHIKKHACTILISTGQHNTW